MCVEEGSYLSDFLWEQFCKIISWGFSSIDNGSDGLTGFMYFNKTFYGGCWRIHVCIFPSWFLWVRILLLFIVFLTWDWKVFVWSVWAVLKLLFCIKSCSLRMYFWVGRMTIEFPLSARVFVATLFRSLDWMLFIVLASCFALFVLGWVFLFFL